MLATDDHHDEPDGEADCADLMFGYGNACYAWLRGEENPDWARYLDTNPRVYMKNGLGYLNHAAVEGGFPHVAAPESPA